MRAIIEQASKPGRREVTAENHRGRRPGEAVAALLMRKGVRCELDSCSDAFLLAGALPHLHDRYGISTAKIVEKLSIVCVNRAAMTHWPLALRPSYPPARRGILLQILCGLSQDLRLPLHGIVVFAILSHNLLKTTPFTGRGGSELLCLLIPLAGIPISCALSLSRATLSRPYPAAGDPGGTAGPDLMASASVTGKTAGLYPAAAAAPDPE